MVQTKPVVKVSFDEKERGDVDFLLAEMNMSTPQKLIRALVSREADVRRGKRLTYGGGPKAPVRETKAERMRRLLALPDADLTRVLRPLLDEEFRKEPEDSIVIETAPASGMRIIRIKCPSTGMNDEVGLDYYFKRWDNEKRLEKLQEAI